MRVNKDVHKYLALRIWIVGLYIIAKKKRKKEKSNPQVFLASLVYLNNQNARIY